ncbi:MAG: hypothetical protein AAFP16_17415 [Pseudomonadota bacterium]
MSDPMTNTEVEDVLSSIRRLVSDDKRADAPAEAPPATDRLVLTPALRVPDEPEHGPETADEADESEMPEAATAPAPLPEGDEPAAEPVPSMETEQFTSVRAPQPVDDQLSDEELDIWSQDAVAEPSKTEPMQGNSENTGNDVFDPPEHSEAEEGAVDAFETTDAMIDVSETDVEDAPDAMAVPEVADSADDPEVEAATQDTPAPVSDVDTAQSLSDKIAALETLIAGQNEEWEPDDAGTDPYAGTQAPSMEWEDADAAADGPTQQVVHDIYEADPDPEPEPQIFATDEDVLDEDALRDLVADIVREELQGALGERITRNVRKLVRREIHRALAAQDLE